MNGGASVESKARGSVFDRPAEAREAGAQGAQGAPGNPADVYDVVIVGAGPAGASAALYAARGKLRTVVIDKAPSSGALAITHKIANYPGVREEISGLELLERMRWQAADFGAAFVHAPVQGVYVEGEVKEVFTPEAVYRGRALIIATGAMERGSKLPGEERYLGRGVSYCATCDGAFYQGATVAVLGDDEEALEESLFLTKFAERVHLVIPGKKLLGVPEGEPLPNLPNLIYHFQHRPVEVIGGERVEGVKVRTPAGEQTVIPGSGVFVYLSGSKPATEFLMGALPVHGDGYLVADEEMATPVPGVFAAGDVRRSPAKQAVLAAADGALAAMVADRFVHGRQRIVSQR